MIVGLRWAVEGLLGRVARLGAVGPIFGDTLSPDPLVVGRLVRLGLIAPLPTLRFGLILDCAGPDLRGKALRLEPT